MTGHNVKRLDITVETWACILCSGVQVVLPEKSGCRLCHIFLEMGTTLFTCSLLISGNPQTRVKQSWGCDETDFDSSLTRK